MVTSCTSRLLSYEAAEEETPHLFNSGSRKLETEKFRHLSVKQAITMMRAHFQEPLTLSDIADCAQLSPFHFNRVFRSITGVPPSVYLAALRIEEAKKLLLRTKLSVTSICFDVGYNSLGTFTTRFTQFVGTSPSHLRQLSRDEKLRRLFYNWDYLKSSLRALQHSTEKSVISGHISVHQPFDGLICVGAFSDPIPQGTPISCTILGEPGHYSISSLPPGKHYLFATALQRSDDFAQLFEGCSPLRCANQLPISIPEEGIERSLDLVLSPVYWTDAPILIALPLLISTRLGQMV